MSAQGPAESPLGEALCETMEVPPSAAEPPVSESCSTAAHLPPATLCEQQEAVASAADCSTVPTSLSEVVPAPERRSSRVKRGRAHDDDTTSCTVSASEAAAVSAAADAGAAAVESATASAVVVPLSEFKERTKIMFKLDSDGPAASGRPGIAPIVTKECVQFAWWAVNELCDDHGPALSEAYGNFDRVVALGWLLGDVALGCQIPGSDAFKAGRKAGKLAPGLKAEFDAPSRRLGKRKQPASDEDWAQASEEEEAIRRELVKLDFGGSLDAPPPAQPVVLQRQRVEMPPPPPPPPRMPPPQPPAAPPSRDPERLELLKAVRAAEAVVPQAECALAAAKRNRDKAKAAWEYAREQASNPHRIAQIPDDKWAAWSKRTSSEMEDARLRYCAAERAIGEPEDALFWAKHELKEARFDLDEYAKERSRQDAWSLKMAMMDAEHEEKVSQIEAGIAHNNAMCNPGDAEYWDPDPQEAAILYRLWKVQ